MTLISNTSSLRSQKSASSTKSETQNEVPEIEKTDEEVTMEIIKEVAESVDPMIQFTVDLPGNYENGKFPVLDVQAGINKENQNKIEFEFFEKTTKNNKVILSDSAIP